MSIFHSSVILQNISDTLTLTPCTKLCHLSEGPVGLYWKIFQLHDIVADFLFILFLKYTHISLCPFSLLLQKTSDTRYITSLMSIRRPMFRTVHDLVVVFQCSWFWKSLHISIRHFPAIDDTPMLAPSIALVLNYFSTTFNYYFCNWIKRVNIVIWLMRF